MSIQQLIRLRHWVQWLFLGIIVAIPFTGWLRINLASGYIDVVGWQVWFDDSTLMLGGLGLILSAGAVFFYPLGQSFCGWLCPQHTVSELLESIIRRLLGRNALAGFDPEKPGSRSKRHGTGKILAWIGFTLTVIVVAAVATLTVLSYYNPTSELLEKLSHVGRNRMFWAFVTALFFLFALDFGLFRHFWCKHLCIVGLFQSVFRGRDTLQIRFESDRESDCKSCSLCQDVCPVDMDPRQPEIYTRCINCGICIDACESYLGRFDKPRLLNFGMGSQSAQLIRIESGHSPVRNARVIWPLLGVLLSLAVLGVGIANYSPLNLTLQMQHPEAGGTGIRFSAEAVNKGKLPVAYAIRIDGFAEGQVHLGRTTTNLAVGEQAHIPLRVAQHGLQTDTPYPFEVVFTNMESGVEQRVSATYFMPQ